MNAVIEVGRRGGGGIVWLFAGARSRAQFRVSHDRFVGFRV